MDVLKNARHRAGMHVAVFGWFFPLVVAAAIVFFALLFVGYSGGDTDRFFIVLGDIVAMIFFVPAIAYFVARNNQKLVRKQLVEIIRCEGMLLPMYAVALARSTQTLQGAIQSRRWVFEAQLAEPMSQETVKMRGCVEKAMEELRDEERGASSKEKLQNQEHFLLLHRTIREFELMYERLDNAKTLSLSEGAYSKFCQVTQANFEKYIETLRTNVCLWEGKIAASKRTISEASKCLQE